MDELKTKHIGILACSAEGASLCYRTICLESQEFLGEHMHPEVSMHTHPLGLYMKGLEWSKVAKIMQSSYDNLCESGAQLIVCPDNTIHQAYELVRQKEGVEWLHIARVVADYAMQNKFKKLAILGTKFLMEGPVYPDQLESSGISCQIPEPEASKKINEIIFDELVNGIFKDESRSYFCKVINELKDTGCDAVVLGCTEIPLLIEQKDSVLPVLDSTRLLARAAIKSSLP